MQTADKASLEVFDKREQDDLATAVIAKHINPAVEIGGDARLLLPEQKRIKSSQETIDGQVRAFCPSLLQISSQILQVNFCPCMLCDAPAG